MPMEILLMPLIDHGNTYDDNGNVEQGRIALGATGTGSFTHQVNSLAQTRMKPMFRAKRVWDQIFEDAGYTYSSDLFKLRLDFTKYTLVPLVTTNRLVWRLIK